MTKPVELEVLGDNYMIDAVVDPTTPVPDMVKAHLRHLLVACELGDLVVIQCTNVIDDAVAYVLCAHVMSVNNVCKLLPICELENTNDLLARMRPPSALPENVFAKPAYSGNYVVDVVEHPDGSVNMQQMTADDESVH